MSLFVTWIKETPRPSALAPASLRAQYGERIISKGLHELPDGKGAYEYLRRFGRNVKAPKLLDLAGLLEQDGHYEMAYHFLVKAWSIDTGAAVTSAPPLVDYLAHVHLIHEGGTDSKLQPPGNDGLDPALSAFIGRYASPGRARMPILITGPHGTGKSHAAHAFYRANHSSVVDGGFAKMCVISGHAGTETMDILGRTELREGRTIWRYSGLGEAIVWASRGERILLFIDEIQRIPARERSVLVSALAAVAGMYRLTTGRPLDIDGEDAAIDEVIEAPVENLSVIATTNLGIHYDVSDVDFAERDRWMRYDFRNTVSSIQPILSGLVAAKGFPMPVVTALVDLWKGGQKAVSHKTIENGPSLRNLIRALECSDSTADLADVMVDMSSIWVSETSQGVERKDHRQVVNSLLSRFRQRIAETGQQSAPVKLARMIPLTKSDSFFVRDGDSQ